MNVEMEGAVFVKCSVTRLRSVRSQYVLSVVIISIRLSLILILLCGLFPLKSFV